MNIQIKRFGVNVRLFDGENKKRDFVGIDEIFETPIELNDPQKESVLRVCIYINTDDMPTSFIKSEMDMSGKVFEYRSQRYQCAESRLGNSPLYRTPIIPLNERDLCIDINAVN